LWRGRPAAAPETVISPDLFLGSDLIQSNVFLFIKPIRSSIHTLNLDLTPHSSLRYSRAPGALRAHQRRLPVLPKPYSPLVLLTVQRHISRLRVHLDFTPTPCDTHPLKATIAQQASMLAKPPAAWGAAGLTSAPRAGSVDPRTAPPPPPFLLVPPPPSVSFPHLVSHHQGLVKQLRLAGRPPGPPPRMRPIFDHATRPRSPWGRQAPRLCPPSPGSRSP
jgi:hypothetical protein